MQNLLLRRAILSLQKGCRGVLLFLCCSGVAMLAMPQSVVYASSPVKESQEQLPLIPRLQKTWTLDDNASLSPEQRRSLFWQQLATAWLQTLDDAITSLPPQVLQHVPKAQHRILVARCVITELPSVPAFEETLSQPWQLTLVSQTAPLTLTELAQTDAWHTAWQQFFHELNLALRPPVSEEEKSHAATTLATLLLHVRPLLEQAKGDWLAPPEAAALLEQCTQLMPKSALSSLLLAESLLQKHLPQQSIQAATHALKQEPTLLRARYLRALAHWRLQQLALAEEDLTAALNARTQYAGQRRQWFRARGALRLLRKQTERMCEDFLEACSLGDCEGLFAVRSQQFCLPQRPNLPSETSYMASIIPTKTPKIRPQHFSFGTLEEGNSGMGLPLEPPLPNTSETQHLLWPPVEQQHIHALQRLIPTLSYPRPDPFIFR